MEINETSLDTLCAALCYAMGIDAPASAAEKNPALTAYLDRKLGEKKADRIFMYNPDAAAQWINEKYPFLIKKVTEKTEIKVPMQCVMPSVTPVCFGTMYTGAQPEVHGIRRYEKPVIRTDSIFDALIRSEKKAAIVADDGCSMSRIFLERDMDYFFFDTEEEVNCKAAQLIREDKYDFIAVYNGNYDTVMHKYGPESIEALGELRTNAESFAVFRELIARYWGGKHTTLLGFAMDHGCHEIDGGCGSHGLDMPEDLNIAHYYTVME